jgi:predicted transposase/invertase (TIGR01784 family)
MTEAILNPTNDAAFKRVFGRENNKDILMHFLNGVLKLKGPERVVEVTLINPDLGPETVRHKVSIVDVLCVDQHGRRFIVEMQVANVGGFEKRAQYYASRAYGNQMKEGGKYSDLKEVVFLGILGFSMFPDKLHYRSVHRILDEEDHRHHLKDLSFVFIELPKFTKDRVEDLVTNEDKWCYFFKHSNDYEEMIRVLSDSDPEMSKAYEELKSHNWTEAELGCYEDVQKAIRDQYSEIMTAKEEGLKEGEKIGIEKGIERGIEQGVQKVALTMLAQGLPIETIVSCTQLSRAQIETLDPSSAQ